MSEPSEWPLSKGAIRILVPNSIRLDLENHVLSRSLFPLALGYYPKAHRHTMKRMVHDDYLLMYCIDGQGNLQLPDESLAIATGDIVVLPPGQSHRYASDLDKPWSLFWCHFQGSDAAAFVDFLNPDSSLPLIKKLNDLTLQSQFHTLISTAMAGYSLAVFIKVANHLRLLLSHIGVSRQHKADMATVDAVSRVNAFMRGNLQRKLSLNELAQESRLSKYYFNRRYRELTGYSPMQHFIHMKMEQACLLLEGSHLGVAEIAFQLGYEDPLYFSRVFRKTLGMSPSDYRNQAK